MSDEENQEKMNDVLERLDWDGPVFKMSAIKKEGTREICNSIMDYLIEHPQIRKFTAEKTQEDFHWPDPGSMDEAEEGSFDGLEPEWVEDFEDDGVEVVYVDPNQVPDDKK